MKNIESRIKQETGSDYLIGRYTKDNQGNHYFTDLRGTEGDVFTIEDIPLEDISYTNESLKEEEFYKFKWNVISKNPITLAINGEVEELDKREFLTALYNAKANLTGSVREFFINNQENLLKEVTGADHTYIYELLQNANDYPSSKDDNIVKVKFVVTPKYLLFLHTGEDFNLKNITAICSVNQGEKKRNTKTIGYKGIGFKTVFVNNEYVYLQSGEWSLRFDRAYVQEHNGKRPWAFMPIPTEKSELDDELKEALHQYGSKYRVFFALRHKRNDASENIPLLDKVFSDNQILLFIPHVYEVSVDVKGEQRHLVTKDANKWTGKQYEWRIPQELHEWVKTDIKNGGKVPPKFEEIDLISISFAAGRDGNKIVPIENARVYNYLPTELKLGFKFLFNADFVPNGSRNNLHPTHWNNEVMEQCGRHFVTWWTSMFANEGEWEPNSVFTLIPEFNSAEEYAKLFMIGFKQAMLQTPCIPVNRNGKYQLAKIADVIWDNLGFTCGENPMFTDEEFYKFVATDKLLPIPSIRQNEVLRKLLTQTFKDKCSIFTGLSLNRLTENEKFREWLAIPKNNIKFNRFLLEENWMMNLKSSSILLSSRGTLARFERLYLDIDTYLERLPLLKDKILYINREVRDNLKDIREWNNFTGEFRTFSQYTFADEVVNIHKKNPSLFDNIDNNVGFIRTLAVLEVNINNYLPDYFCFIDEEGNKATTKQNLFRKSDFGTLFVEQPWVKKEWVSFISEKYFEQDQEKVIRFLEPTAIKPIDTRVIYRNFLTEDKHIPYITKAIKDPKQNIAFYRFLAVTARMDSVAMKFDPKMKGKYTVMATDGINQFNVLMSQQIFSYSEEWEECIKRSWMPTAICLSLSQEYTDGLDDDDSKRMTAFFQNPQIVTPLTIGTLSNLVKSQKNLQAICNGIKDKNASKDFLDFLFTNRVKLFNGEKPGSMFQDIPVLLEGKEELTAISAIKGWCYGHNDDLDTLLQQEWSKTLNIEICSDYYNDLLYSKERKVFFEQLGIHYFDLVTYVRKHILASVTSFRQKITDRTANIKFHKFLYQVHRKFSVEDTEKFNLLPIYICAPNNEKGELVYSAKNHYLPSKLLTEIINLDIVPSDLLDCIHPDYIDSKDERNYYEEILNNTEIDKEDFIDYIIDENNIQDVKMYLRDRERNLRFWRWVYDAKFSFKTNEKLKDFPMMGHHMGTVTEEFVTPQDLFISSTYSNSNNVESIVSEFTEDPYFICSDYKEENDNREWNNLFRALRVTIDTREIVFKHILPNLNSYQRTDIVELIADHESDISDELKKGNQTLKHQLSEIHLKCADGKFRKPAESLLSGEYFNIETDPLPEIPLNNLITEEYIIQEGISQDSARRIKRLLVSISDSCGNVCSTLTALRYLKIKKFLQSQTAYTGEDHLKIIASLASDYQTDSEGIKELLSGKVLLLYDTENKIHKASELYLSTAYHPDCDFMGHGVNNRYFISEDYLNWADESTLSQFFTNLYVWSSFTEKELPLLNNAVFSRYFWQEYAPNRQYALRHICTAEHLKSIACIPSPLGNKRPGDLYDYRKEQLQKIVLSIPNGQDKLPNVNLPKWLDYIGLRNRLYIPDCLQYLLLDTVNFRRDILRWITESDNEIINHYHREINQYLASANWINGKKQWAPLNSLVALEWENNTLKGNFSNNASVCNPSYMPESQSDYNKICQIFKIKILTNHDFKKVKSGKWSNDDIAKSEIQKRLLYLSYKTGKENWIEVYKQRKDQLASCEICSCSQIDFQYNENITTDLLSYTSEDNKLWYVGRWNESMFLDILDWVKRVFKINGLDDSYLKKLFLSDFHSFLKEYEHDLPTEFLNFLDEADKEGLLEDHVETIEEYIEEEEQENSADLPEELNHANENEVTEIDDTNTDLPEHQDTINHQRHEKQNTAEDRTTESSENTTEKDKERFGHKEESHERKTRSDKGGHHERNQEYSDQPTSTEEEKNEPQKAGDLQSKLKEKWNAKSEKTLQRPTSSYKGSTDFEYETPNTSKQVSDEDFFQEDYQAPQPRKTNTSKARENLKRKNTEAQDKAEKAQEELEINDLLEQTPKYTFLWFKYLMELMYSNKSKMGTRSTRVDFFDKEIICDDKVLHLYNPTSVIPEWLENADDVQISVYQNGSAKKLHASIVGTTDISIDIMLNEKEKISDYQECSMFRLQAENNTNFIDSLNTRFLQLPYEDDFNMEENLPKDIKFIYGPPGTGKTTKLVEELENIIKSAQHKTNVLVLTPTNKAADVIAKKLSDNDLCFNYLSRYGTTEDTYLIEDAAIVTTRDTMNMDTFDHNIMVTTVARFSYDTIKPNDEFICDYKWDYIVLDEASMIDIVNATFILHKSFNSKFIIAGDPKQIQPANQNDIDIENIYQMIGINELRHAISSFNRYPLIPLLTQYRSVPLIGKLVSDFAYDGLVEPYQNRQAQKPLQINGLDLKTINFLGFEMRHFDHLYGAGAIKDSAYQLYSAIFTYNMAGYLAKRIKKQYKNDVYTIGIVSPYQAEAKAIKQMIEERPIGNENCKITCGTVHSFQGDECDIMFVVMNPPEYVTRGTHINKQEIINVAMSRARDYLFFVLPEGQIKGLELKNRIGHLVNDNDRTILRCSNLEKVIFGKENYILEHTEITCHQPVNVYYKPSAEYEIRVDDTAMDIKINDIW